MFHHSPKTTMLHLSYKHDSASSLLDLDQNSLDYNSPPYIANHVKSAFKVTCSVDVTRV